MSIPEIKEMRFPMRGWFVQKTQSAACTCGTLKQHWINHATISWPTTCAVVGCTGVPDSGVYASHATMEGELVVPMCDECRSRGGTFSLKEGSVVVASKQGCG